VLADVSTIAPICHEMIHAFRDDDIIFLSSFEEGMTRAAEVEVLNRLPGYDYFDRNHSYTYDVYYEALNRKTIGSKQGNFFQGYVSVLLRYQLAGYAWGKLFIENPSFFSDFNKALYADVLADSSILWTESKLVRIVDKAQPRIEAEKFLSWYSQQGVLDTAPPSGYFLYQRINQFTVDFFSRDESGVETMLANAPVEWEVFDFQNTLLSSGSDPTSAYGWMGFIPSLPDAYQGRIKVVVTAMTPNGAVSDTALRAIGSEKGVFGIITDASTGEITITPVKNRALAVTVPVSNGAFFAQSLASERGRFLAVFNGANGERISMAFTKDASDYFISLGP
jgi:hypothetical protein